MCGAETEVKATQRLPYLGLHPIKSNQTPTLDEKHVPKGACHGCLQRGPARALQIQRQKLATNYWTGLGVPNGGSGGWSRGAEGVYSPMGRTMTSDTQTPQDSKGLNHQPRGIHGSIQKCGRGIPCWASVGGMVLGQVKAQ